LPAQRSECRQTANRDRNQKARSRNDGKSSGNQSPRTSTNPNASHGKSTDKKRHKKLVKRVRHEIDAPPPVPASIEQLVIQEDYRIYKRSAAAQEPFLLADSGIYNEADFWSTVVSRLGIGDEEHQLRRHTPAPFTQVYVILARRDKWVFPVCHCLLTAKTQATYERMFDLLQQCWPMFKPRVASIDFEQAEQGLTHLYNTDASFSQAARMITSLAFLN
uniref:MULE domain-containing protein n=1 Tax=Globodera pallida TaxID=36090 RepID=A0A183CRJ9_GLOPA